jgi:hypothetical protein
MQKAEIVHVNEGAMSHLCQASGRYFDAITTRRSGMPCRHAPALR